MQPLHSVTKKVTTLTSFHHIQDVVKRDWFTPTDTVALPARSLPWMHGVGASLVADSFCSRLNYYTSCPPSPNYPNYHKMSRELLSTFHGVPVCLAILFAVALTIILAVLLQQILIKMSHELLLSTFHTQIIIQIQVPLLPIKKQWAKTFQLYYTVELYLHNSYVAINKCTSVLHVLLSQ